MTKRALPPPQGVDVAIDGGLIEQAIEGSRQSLRRRVILPLHRADSELLHRMLNAVQPGTYIQPHRHLSPPKAEAIVVLRGAIGFVTFEDGGEVGQRLVLAATSAQLGIDIQPGVYHTFVALEADTVLFEVKPGPYDEKTDKDFAPWAPREGGAEAPSYLAKLEALFR